jgi:dTDP-4-dehydrorhamnose 3,5-epimerase
MKFTLTAISGVVLIEPHTFCDNRGFFMETYQSRKFCQQGIDYQFVQDNHSGSHGGVLRGLHYQIKQPQGKLVRVVQGEVYDVAVDLRQDSPTFAQAIGIYLSQQNQKQLWIPPGFAHGFYVVSAWAEVVYKATNFYAPEWERTILWNDPALNIDWPLSGGQPPIVSDKDAQGKLLVDAEVFQEL